MGRLAAQGEMEEHTCAPHLPQKPNLFHPCLGDLSCLFLNVPFEISLFSSVLLCSKLPCDPQNAYQIVEQMPSVPGLLRHVWLHICSHTFAFMSYLYFCFSTLQTKVLITICADVNYLYKNHSMTAQIKKCVCPHPSHTWSLARTLVLPLSLCKTLCSHP